MAKRLELIEKDISCVADELVSSSQLEYIDDFNFVSYLEDFDSLTEASFCTGFMHPNQNSVNEIVYRNPSNRSRLPDSPPITEISGAGSSGSPSSTESPYSPENYRNFPNQAMHGTHQASSGVILGVPDLPANLMVPQELLIQNQQNNINNRAMGNLPSPPDFNNVFTPQAPSSNISQEDSKEHLQGTPVFEFLQVSPPSLNVRQMAGYQAQNNGYQIDPYNNMMNSVTCDTTVSPQTNDMPINRKRMRQEQPSLTTAHHQSKHDNSKVYSMPNHMSVAPSPAATDEFEDTFHQQAIKFTKFNEEHWAPLFDFNQRQLNQLEMHVVADKGFNFSSMDNCFVNQKKNHFQISVHIEAIDNHAPNFVKIGNELKVIQEFKLAFCGVKSEMPSSEIQIKQSTTDRRPVPHDPVSLEIHERRMTKVTVPRLHFSETTMNNQRKNGRPNPDQKYFLLVVRLIACSTDAHEVVVQAYQSEKVIVRASNPGQFEPPDSDATWQKNGTTLFYNNGSVAIGTDRAIAPLTVGGDIYCTGNFHRPSDRRFKERIKEVDAKNAISRLSQIRVVGYSYKPELADKWGLTEENRHRVGVIAQELAEILPDAVTDNGDFLQVDDSRIFYETVAAATELCRLTGTLEQKIAAVEKISQRLAKLYRRNRDVGSMASGLSEFGFGDKSLMASRTSLDSNITNRSRYTRSTNRAQCKKHSGNTCDNHSPQVCNTNHYAQKIVPCVMIAMTICVFLMSGLYVFDWYGRTFHGRQVFDSLSTSAPSEEIIDNVVQLKNFTGIGFIQPNVPPVHIACDHNHCQPHCCGISSERGSLTLIRSLERKKSNKPWDPIPLSSGLSIKILTVNMTLDERYCVNDSCLADRGSYTLFVPISPYMPTIPLEVKINSPDSSSYIDSCGSLREQEFHEKGCGYDRFYDLSKEFDARKIVGDVYEVLVGNHLQSAYRFRVGYSTPLCFMDDSQRGKSFDEYNIVFYRQCLS